MMFANLKLLIYVRFHLTQPSVVRRRAFTAVITLLFCMVGGIEISCCRGEEECFPLLIASPKFTENSYGGHVDGDLVKPIRKLTTYEQSVPSGELGEVVVESRQAETFVAKRVPFSTTGFRILFPNMEPCPREQLIDWINSGKAVLFTECPRRMNKTFLSLLDPKTPIIVKRNPAVCGSEDVPQQ